MVELNFLILELNYWWKSLDLSRSWILVETNLELCSFFIAGWWRQNLMPEQLLVVANSIIVRYAGAGSVTVAANELMYILHILFSLPLFL